MEKKHDPSLKLNLDSPSMEASFRPALFPTIDSTSSLNSKDSLQKYLAERSEEDNLRLGFNTFLDYSRTESSFEQAPSKPDPSPRFNFDSKDAAEIVSLRIKVEQLQQENARLTSSVDQEH